MRLVEPLAELSGASFVPVFGVGMKRLILTVGLALAGALLVPSVAAADKPIREGLSAEDFTIEGSCAFDVDFHVLVNKESILPAFHLAGCKFRRSSWQQRYSCLRTCGCLGLIGAGLDRNMPESLRSCGLGLQASLRCFNHSYLRRSP